jgi:SAM-dependent methyltransferase
MDLKEVQILGKDIGQHWYYRSKARAMHKMLGDVAISSILDVGAGSGFFSRYLLAQTDAQQACCVDTSYEADSESLEAGKPVHYRQALEPLEADLVLLMDVLEHVDDDRGLLRDCMAKVPAKTRFLITVPAFNFLWSGHDVFLEHRRRYTLPELEAVVKAAGLKLVCGAYYFGLVFPLAAGVRLLGSSSSESRSQLRQHHQLTNAVLGALCRLELAVLPFNRLAGLSVFCLAVKP